MLDPTSLSPAEFKLRRKKILEEFNDEINGYARDLTRTLNGRNLNKAQLVELQKEIENLEEMRKFFYSEVKILKRRKNATKPLRKGFFGLRRSK